MGEDMHPSGSLATPLRWQPQQFSLCALKFGDDVISQTVFFLPDVKISSRQSYFSCWPFCYWFSMVDSSCSSSSSLCPL